MFCVNVRAADELELSSSYAWYNSSGEWVDIKSSTSVPAGTYELRLQVRLSEALKKGNVYDLRVEFEHLEGNKISLNRYSAMNASSNLIKDFSATSKFVNGTNKSIFYLYDCTYSSDDLVILRIYLDDVVSAIPHSSSGTLYIQNIKVFADNITVESTVKSIFQAILSIPSKVADAFKSLFNLIVDTLVDLKTALSSLLQSIVDGLVDLGNFLLEGLKNLFVPNDDFIVSYKDKWDKLLAGRFGAVYEVMTIFTKFVDTVSSASGSQSSIKFPTYTLELSEGEFVFGGWNVNIVPSGFNVVFKTLKTLVNIIVTIVIINMCKDKLYKLLEGT